MSTPEAAAIYFVGINLVACLAFVIDKERAEQGRWRIPERTLLWLAAIGGSIGAITAQQLIRHKTRKEPFRTYLWLIAGAQAFGVPAIYIYLRAR